MYFDNLCSDFVEAIRCIVMYKEKQWDMVTERFYNASRPWGKDKPALKISNQ